MQFSAFYYYNQPRDNTLATTSKEPLMNTARILLDPQVCAAHYTLATRHDAELNEKSCNSPLAKQKHP